MLNQLVDMSTSRNTKGLTYCHEVTLKNRTLLGSIQGQAAWLYTDSSSRSFSRRS